jgi:hypothetical protein
MDADPRDQLIHQLQAENTSLRRELETSKDRIQQLMQMLEQLQRELHRQAAPFRRKDKDKKPPDEHKPPGRPPGHPPAFRPQPPQIDDHVEAKLNACPNCGHEVHGLRRCEQTIEEIPVLRPHVTKVITYVGTCPRCGEVRSRHPMQVSQATGAAGVQLGARAMALAAWLSKRLGLTTRATCRALEALAGLHLSPGGLVQALHRMADKTAVQYALLRQDLRSENVNADETSWWVGSPSWWLWVFTSPRTVLYRVDNSRGRKVVLDVLGEDFPGVLTSDCLASYENLPYRMHKCYAHHLKAISQAREQQMSTYLEDLKYLLKAAMALRSIRGNLSPPDWIQRRRYLDTRADELLSTPRPEVLEERVRLRLKKRRQWLFTFLDCPGVEPTNNRAERELRPAVIARKLSCGNKTQRGKQTWEILTSLAATCHLRSLDFTEYLRPYLILAPAPVR